MPSLGALEFVTQPLVFAVAASLRQRTARRVEEVFGMHGLENVGIGASSHRVDGALERAVTRNDHNLHERRQCTEAPDDVEPANVRQVQIHESDVERALLHECNCGRTASGNFAFGSRLDVCQQLTHAFGKVTIVINDEK